MIKTHGNQLKTKKKSLVCQPIAQTGLHKFLGLFIENKLKFDTNFNKPCTKVSQSFGVMKCISQLVPMNFPRNLNYTLVYSRFTYAITGWGSVFNATTRRLEVLI